MKLLTVGVIIILFTKKGFGEDQRVCWYTSRTVGQLSVQHIDTSPDYADDADYGVSRIQGPNQTCPKPTNYCYALWKEQRSHSGSGGVIIIAQGCWESSGKQDCEKSNCIASRKPPKALNDTNFCCCRGNFCNGNVTQMYYQEETQNPIEDLPSPVVKFVEKPYLLILIVLLVLFLFTASCFPALLLLSRWSQKKKDETSKLYPDSVHLMENGSIHNSNFTVDNLKLEGIIGQGRYGTVWKGSVGDQEVAVKIFPSHHRNYFFNELDVYCVPFMTHPSLLSYFGYDERINAEGNPEYFLFLSYAPNGTVQDYLHLNVLDWNTFCKMALSIAKGVAYLHTDIRKGDKFKPCVSHRDLNTKNILVKEDLTCAICDLGFATKISGSKYYYNGEEQHAETKSINDVGTLRYMSPEVLEGAVNLRDCETSLKQIDVYALGLILWELSSRCSDFYPTGVECAPYRLPFEAEIGHPTFEQMQILVCKHKARPLFPDLWRDSPAVRSVKETIEDCWDQDAEARLTALCVEERFHELCEISDRQKVSLYPCGISPTVRTSVIQKDSQNVLIVSDNKEESCLSESTVETLVAITPANHLANSKNSNQFQGVCPAVQPYQGRNPCLERNLMLPQDCDSNSDELIDKSHKHITCHMVEPSLVTDYLNIYPPSGYTNYNGYANHSEPVMRSNAPIPFLQNVNVEHSSLKQSNLHKSTPPGRKISWKNFKKLFESKRKEDISPQIDCNVKSNLINNENYLNLSTPTGPLEVKLETEVSLSKGKPETKIAFKDDSTLSKILELTKMDKDYFESSCSVLATQNNKRPNTLPLAKDEDLTKSGNTKNNEFSNINRKIRNFDNKRYSLVGKNNDKEERTAKTKSLTEVEELKILRLESELEEEATARIADTHKSLVGIMDGVSKKSETIPPSGNSVEVEMSGESSGTQAVKLKDPNSRVKTPGDMPVAMRKMRGEKNAIRFSLYDDRMMSGLYDNETLYSTGKELGEQGDVFNSFDNIKFSQEI